MRSGSLDRRVDEVDQDEAEYGTSGRSTIFYPVLFCQANSHDLPIRGERRPR
jgi:hypothetical protein